MNRLSNVCQRLLPLTRRKLKGSQTRMNLVDSEESPRVRPLSSDVGWREMRPVLNSDLLSLEVSIGHAALIRPGGAPNILRNAPAKLQSNGQLPLSTVKKTAFFTPVYCVTKSSAFAPVFFMQHV
jgi:hypothetical protein